MLSTGPKQRNIDPREIVVLSDSFPTGLECGTLNANIQPGNSVVIVGASPVGIAAMLTAKLYTLYLIVMIDKDEKRLELAQKLGADKVINVQSFDAMEQLDSVVDGRGFDSVIEAVGAPSTFDLCQKLLGPGGSLANIGVHGKHAALDLDKLWDRNITFCGYSNQVVSSHRWLRTRPIKPFDRHQKKVF
ncbi:uncharacterized protein N7496_005701 [Penicillium cataractarum]|uniref:Alcohol dehydrogenase-like C-terminal domain-containing protein n=1 Tax=Penicillium cataractarum TaxID=2100454 RepID=A0A9W9SGN4_9EURO|nr:uncharacterized protein N7496_005701 [Penicillium cataractarum]KAJ5378292.1 hypothetical protein N7496_005701 [Penicillium cataractarum]